MATRPETRKRVVITGLGVVSPLGVGKDEFWKNLLQGRSRIGAITRFDASQLPTRIGGEMVGFDARPFLSAGDCRRFDDYAQYALAATRLSVDDGGIDLARCDRSRIGVVVGSCHGAMRTIEREVLAYHRDGPHGIGPFAMANASSNIAAAVVAIQLGLKGPNFSVVSACASGTQAVGEAYRTIASGAADAMLAGGSEAAITPFVFAGYSFISAMSRRNDDPGRACRPFDRRRDGFVMSEGAGMLLLEDLEHARRRGVSVYAEIVGFGASDDAAHVTNLTDRGVGVRRAMEAALDDAGIGPEDVDYVNTHGSSTPLADRCEAAALRDLFKERTREMAINSTKSLTGHMMGASGAVEAIVCALSLRDQVVHGTANYEEEDPDCALEGITSSCVRRPLKYVLSNSIGFGGPVGTLAFARHEAMELAS
jgi:3-oxoacyl-[acyl-carrier-protein] synthase II